MLNYATRRLFLIVPTLVGMSLLVFAMIRLVPGDFIEVMLGTQRGMITEKQAQALYQVYGLDKPWPVQYWEWLKSVFKGTMGYSLRTGRTVMVEIMTRFPVTAELTLFSLLIGLTSGLALGILSAIKRGRLSDAFTRIGGLVGLSIPKFWLGLIIILVLSIYFRWVPPTGSLVDFTSDPLGNLAQFVFPALALGLGLAAEVMRISRSAMLEVLYQDYVTTAYSKGLSDRAVWLRHCLRNALIPVTTFVGMQVGYLLGGTVVVESVFSLPGIGRLLLNAVYQRDYPLVQGVVLFIAFNFAVINLLVDLFYSVIDPRIRYT